MRRRAGVLIALALLAAGSLLLWLMLPAPQNQPDTAALFAASFPDAQGQPQALSQWRGKLLVVNFWASWCPPCLEEMPELSALQRKYAGQGVVVLGISTDDAAKMQEFAHSTPTSYPLLAGDFDAMQLAAQLGNDRGVLPYTVLVRGDGSVVWQHFGRLDMQALKQALGPLSGSN